MNIKAFTLVELVVIVIVLGLLAGLAIPQFQKQLERGRAAEAYRILGEIRTAQEIWKNEHGGSYTLNVEDLGLGLIGFECDANHFFSYSINIARQKAIAWRCIADGKEPQGKKYYIELDLATGEIDDSLIR